MREEQLYQLICDNTASRDIADPAQRDCFTTSHMAQRLGIARNLASAALNRLYATGALVKINTRPVYYLDRTQLEQRYGAVILSTMFYSLEQLLALLQGGREQEDIFATIIGHDKSLREPIAQCKAAAYYPGTGLPLLISGPSGTGKSVLARLIHSFCVRKKIIGEGAPFVTFNCSDYADNPELLTGILFGYVKGAFTGADKDREGLLQQADGGVLFLDEAHRLSPNGQEKLFVFMDQGIFSRLGEAGQTGKSSVRLVFATTEQPGAVFLRTFLRRIPVTVRMPALEEKGADEVVQLICHILARQSGVLGHPFVVSQHFFQILLGCRLAGNIGELQNACQYACAAAYQQLGERGEQGEILLEAHHLPSYIIAQVRERRWEGIAWNTFPERVRIHQGFRFESIRRLLEKPAASPDLRAAFYNIFYSFQEAGEKGAGEKVLPAVMEALGLYMDILEEEQASSGWSVQFDMYHTQTLALLERFQDETAVSLRGKLGQLLANHLFRRANYLNLDAEVPLRPAEELLEFFGRAHPDTLARAKELGELLASGMGLRLRSYDQAILCLCVHWELDRQGMPARGLILSASGAAAACIATAVNRLLGAKVFEAARLDAGQGHDQALDILTRYLERRERDHSGSVVLVDNALTAQLLDDRLRHKAPASYLLLGRVSTELARGVGEALARGDTLEEMAGLAASVKPVEALLNHKLDQKPLAIITTCITGMGTAETLAGLLRETISPWLPEMVFLPREYKSLRMGGTEDGTFRQHEVVAVFGTADPDIPGIPFVDLGQAMAEEEQNPLFEALRPYLGEEELRAVGDKLVVNFSLQRVLGYLTILNPERVMESVSCFIAGLERGTRRRLSNPVKLLLYIHISCMIERLIKKAPASAYEELSSFRKRQKRFLAAARESLSVIENNYSVTVSDDEIGFIYDIVSLKQDSSVFSREI